MNDEKVMLKQKKYEEEEAMYAEQKRKLEVVEGVKNETENQTSSKKARRMEVSVARGVMELSLENKARYRPKTGVTNKSEPEIVNNGSFNNISSNSNSKKVANKEKNGPHIQRGKFKAGGKKPPGPISEEPNYSIL